MFLCWGWKKRTIPKMIKFSNMNEKTHTWMKHWGVKSFLSFCSEKVVHVRFATLPAHFVVLKHVGSSIKILYGPFSPWLASWKYHIVIISMGNNWLLWNKNKSKLYLKEFTLQLAARNMLLCTANLICPHL